MVATLIPHIIGINSGAVECPASYYKGNYFNERSFDNQKEKEKRNSEMMAMRNYKWKVVLIFTQLLSKLYSATIVAVRKC